MVTLQNALVKAYTLTNKKNPAIIDAIKNLNKQNKIIAKNLNGPIRNLNSSGIKNSNMIKSLNNTTKNITPLSRQALDIRITVAKSLTSQQEAQTRFKIVKDLKATKEVSKNGMETAKTIILPVALEKPIASLHQAAGSIKNVTLPKSQAGVTEDISIETKEVEELTKPEMDREPSAKKELGQIITQKKTTSDEIVEPTIAKDKEVPEVTMDIKPIHAGDAELDISSLKPVRIKDIDFTHLPEPKKTDQVQGVKPPGKSRTPKVDELIETKIPDSEKKILEEAKVHDFAKKPVHKPVKTVVPIMNAISLLSGSIGAREIIPPPTPVKPTSKTITVEPKTRPGKGIPEVSEKTTVQKISPDFKGQKTVEQEPITDEQVTPAISHSQVQTETDLEKPIDYSKLETEPKIEKIARKDDLIGTKARSEPKIKKAEPVKLTSWIPITAAIGLFGGMAGTSMDTNIQAKKERLIPKPGLSLPTAKQIPDDTGKFKPKTTTSKPKFVKEKVKIVTPKLTKPASTTKQEEIGIEEITMRGKKETIESIPELKPSKVKPIAPMIPAAGALGLLSSAAFRTAPEENLILKSPVVTRDDQDRGLDLTSISKSKRFSKKDTNIPQQTDSAIDDLTSAAEKTKKSLYLDQVKPVRTKKIDKLTPIEEPIIARSKRVVTEQAKRRVTKPKEELEHRQLELIKPPHQPIERGLLISKSSVGALDILSTAAISTAITKADIISKSPVIPPSKARVEEVYKLPPVIPTLVRYTTAPKIPVTKTVTVSTIKPDISPYRAPEARETLISDIEKPFYSPSKREIAPSSIPIAKGYKEVTYKPPEISKKGMEALGALNLLASSTILPKQQVPKLGAELGESRLPGVKPVPRGITPITEPPAADITKPGIPSDIKVKPRYGPPKTKEAISEAGKKIPHPMRTVRKIPSISEAFQLIYRRPERKIAKQMGIGLGLERPSTESIERVIKTRTGQELTATRARVGVVPTERQIYKPRTMRPGGPLKSKPELYQASGPRSIDFDRIPTGAPVRRDYDKEQMSNLEQQVRILEEKLKADAEKGQLSGNKIQEFVHDPTLQIQLKKLFYESWLENMDKELKRYGE